MSPIAPLLEPLPIDAQLPAIISSLRKHAGLVITAPPGTGKTTRVPRAVLDSGLAGSGEILVLQPRRLATRMAAVRVAAELGESPGRTVGFAMRFDSVGGPATRIRFVTEGVLSRRIVQDPILRGVAVVIVDEFHERHIATDLALALLRRLQQRERTDLKVLVMSATMDPVPVAAFLGNTPVITSEAKRFPLAIEFEQTASERPLHEKVVTAVTRLHREDLDGDILVFLPGAAEIRQATAALQPIATRENLAVVPLHGDLAPAQQNLAVAPCSRRRIILATNVAETSITVPGIAAVVDSGLARVAMHSAWTGIPSLKLARISKASAEQRAGRAGRTQKGRVIRLYTRTDFESRSERDLPEIRRADLAETLLTLHGAGLAEPRNFCWFEAPPDAAMEAAEDLLRALAALDKEGRLTDIGHSMLRFPVHPRLARLIIEGVQLDVADEAALIAALLSERDIRLEYRVPISSAGRRFKTGLLGSSDPIDLLNRFQEAEEAGFDTRRTHTLGLDLTAIERVRRAHQQLSKLLRPQLRKDEKVDDVNEALQIAILSAFPDRVAKRRARGSRDLLLSVGGAARLSESSSVHEAPLLVAVDVEERRDQGVRKGGSEALVRLASAIEPEWLAALFPNRLRQETEIHWNEPASRVDEAKRTYYDQIALEEIVRPAPPSPAVTRLLADAILSRDLTCFGDQAAVGELQVRLEILADSFPKERIPKLDQELLRASILDICRDKHSFAEIAGVSVVDQLLRQLTSHQKDMLRSQVPDHIALGGRRNLRVHYEPGKPPWIESRLQDFFRIKTTPSICSGRIPLTMRLLAPNGRPVQITQDLAGFWRRHYPRVRRELQRRYPKHAWPDPDEI